MVDWYNPDPSKLMGGTEGQAQTGAGVPQSASDFAKAIQDKARKEQEIIQREMERARLANEQTQKFASAFPMLTASVEGERYKSFDNPYDAENRSMANALYGRAANGQRYQIDQGMADRQMGGFNASQDMGAESRDYQRQNLVRIGQLLKEQEYQASGKGGPSAAQGVLQAGRDQAVQNALAIANSGRGNRSAAMRQAQFSGAGAMQNTANQATILRAQEQQQAQQNLQGTLGLYSGAAAGMRGQDYDAAKNYLGARGQDIDVARSNLGASVTQQQQEFQNLLAATATKYGMNSDEVRRMIDRQKYIDSVRLSSFGLQQAQNQANTNSALQGVGIGANVGSALAGTLLNTLMPKNAPVDRKLTDDEKAIGYAGTIA